jgi:hypothetical protein
VESLLALNLVWSEESRTSACCIYAQLNRLQIDAIELFSRVPGRLSHRPSASWALETVQYVRSTSMLAEDLAIQVAICI